MREPLTREIAATPAGRRRAMRDLMLADHGIVRKLYDNSHEIAPGVWRSYQPSPARLRSWAKRGIRTVVNLRGPRPAAYLFLEEQTCRALGLKLVSFRLFSREAPSREILHGARALIEEIDYPALFHCKSGADRAGLMATLYLFFREKRPLDQAMKQLSWRHGHVSRGKTGIIDAALLSYIDHARDKNIALDDVEAFFRWVDGAYDPARVKRDFMASWWGNLVTERLWKRE